MPLTAAQIVADALAIAKCPGYREMGGRQLNLTLDDLTAHRNLKVNLVTGSIDVDANSNGPFDLPEGYRRTYNLLYRLQGEPYFLNPCALREMDTDNTGGSASGYPTEWASDLSDVANGGVGKLYIYPASSGALTLTHRYYLDQPDILTPESNTAIPWFEDQDYLVVAVAMRMMRFTDDSRYNDYVQQAENLLRKHLLMEGDEQQVVKSVQLDPRRFRTGGSSRPTKLDPW